MKSLDRVEGGEMEKQTPTERNDLDSSDSSDIKLLMMVKESDTEVMTESESDRNSDWLPEKEQRKKRNPGRKRKMIRNCRRKSQQRPFSVQASNQKTPKRRRSELPRRARQITVSNALREYIRRNSKLLVRCGYKGGVLDKEKFNNGEACIFSEQQLFTPSEFEKFGEKERRKKWKSSIFYRQHTLQTLIQVMRRSGRDKQKAAQLLMMGEESDIKTKMETESESKSLSESETKPECKKEPVWKAVELGRKRKIKSRSCSKNDQLGPSSVEAFNQERPTKRPPSSEPCILPEKKWFTPSQFEKFGGKDTIFNATVKLQRLLEEDILSSQSPKQRRRLKEECRRALFSSSTRSRPNSHTQDVITLSDSSSEHQSGAEDEDGEDHADLAQFQGDSFPVTCSTGRGILHKKRFATEKRGKCIRTEDSWKTPQQFVNENLSDGNWRRDIISYRKRLGILIQRRVLEPDAANCPCPTCRGENERDQDNDDECFICKSEEGNLVCCDGCPRAFHHTCHNPPLQDSTLGDPWICSFCREATTQCNADGPSGAL
ncbi:uncharacterized protein [Salminus brasiliensis]|uniref:uncharacterized protein n=1 Tax=Salminus brasiliensis TaxID=930266 RepID=UPI003B831EAE